MTTAALPAPFPFPSAPLLLRPSSSSSPASSSRSSFSDQNNGVITPPHPPALPYLAPCPTDMDFSATKSGFEDGKRVKMARAASWTEKLAGGGLEVPLPPFYLEAAGSTIGDCVAAGQQRPTCKRARTVYVRKSAWSATTPTFNPAAGPSRPAPRPSSNTHPYHLTAPTSKSRPRSSSHTSLSPPTPNILSNSPNPSSAPNAKLPSPPAMQRSYSSPPGALHKLTPMSPSIPLKELKRPATPLVCGRPVPRRGMSGHSVCSSVSSSLRIEDGLVVRPRNRKRSLTFSEAEARKTGVLGGAVDMKRMGRDDAALGMCSPTMGDNTFKLNPTTTATEPETFCASSQLGDTLSSSTPHPDLMQRNQPCVSLPTPDAPKSSLMAPGKKCVTSLDVARARDAEVREERDREEERLEEVWCCGERVEGGEQEICMGVGRRVVKEAYVMEIEGLRQNDYSTTLYVCGERTLKIDGDAIDGRPEFHYSIKFPAAAMMKSMSARWDAQGKLIVNVPKRAQTLPVVVSEEVGSGAMARWSSKSPLGS